MNIEEDVNSGVETVIEYCEKYIQRDFLIYYIKMRIFLQMKRTLIFFTWYRFKILWKEDITEKPKM